MPHFCPIAGCSGDTGLCQICKKVGCGDPQCVRYIAMRWEKRLGSAGLICEAHTEGQVLAFLTQRRPRP